MTSQEKLNILKEYKKTKDCTEEEAKNIDSLLKSIDEQNIRIENMFKDLQELKQLKRI